MLDIFFKKYAWTANLLLIFAAAWLGARIVNTAVGAMIRPRPTAGLTGRPAPPPKPEPPPPQLDMNRLYALIGQKAPASANDPGAQTARNCWEQDAEPIKTSLRAHLVAAVVADDPRASIATITDLNSRESRVYGIGDEILGASILSIERLSDEQDSLGFGFKVVAIVCNNGQKEFIDFDSDETPSTSPAPSTTPVVRRRGGPTPEQIAAAADGVKSVGDNRYEVKKKYIDDTLSNLNAVSTQARIVPSFKDGVSNGFKLFSIQPGSLYSAIGVQNGDVIQRINGYEINSPDKALEIYQKLRESSHITLELERKGQIVKKEYNVSGM